MPAGQELENAVADLVGDRPHFIDGKPGRIGEVPVEVSLAGEDRAGTTAPHGDHDIGGLHLAGSERLEMLTGDLEADFGHGLHDGGIEFIGRL
ncbi:MAG TPA: hypothetical protein VF060_33975 [Trebonia sp.]